MQLISHSIGDTPVLPPLKYFKAMPEAFAPEWATHHAGCFDVRACLPRGTNVVVYEPNCEKVYVNIDVSLDLKPGQRAVIPTGLVLDIPFGYKVDGFSRSGLALKQGLVLVNGVAKIDSDYVEQTYVLLMNVSSISHHVTHGTRIAQLAMVHDDAYELLETDARPQQRTNRNGGLGSTGVA